MSTSEPKIVLDGKYRLEAWLGAGATGEVYRALHLGLKKTFAVKLLKEGSRDPVSLARFRREAETLGRLKHPHVVEVTDFGIDVAAGGIPYLVMELLDGSTLAEVCRASGPLPPERALPLLAAIAEAIDAAHACGVLHRDLKPGNVLLCPAPDGVPRVKVLDFGLAEIAERGLASPGGELPAEGHLTGTGALLGTPLYVAPELIRQQAASPASDVYALGVIAYELLAGHPPFRGSTREVLTGHLEATPPALLPEEVWEAVREPLRKDPAERPGSAGEVVRRLRRAVERAARRQWWASELPRRAGLSAVLTALLVSASLVLPSPPLPWLEHRVQDLRVRSAPARPPDPRILLLTLDEASLGEGAPPLADRAEEIAATLDRVLAAGARRVAIDLLLPARWSDAPAFSDLVLRHHDRLTLAAASGPGERVIGTECIAGLTAAALGPQPALALFGFVNLDEDADGVTRAGRVRYRDRSGALRPSWAAHVATAVAPLPAAVDGFLVDSRIDWPRFARISWRDVPAALDREPELFQGRLVLVGGDFEGSGDDYHRVSHRSQRTEVVSGLTLQALLVDTIVSGLPVREPPRPSFLAVTALCLGLALFGVFCAPRVRPAVLLLGAVVLCHLGVSFPAFWWAGWVLPVSFPLVLVVCGVFLVLVVRRWLPPAPEVS